MIAALGARLTRVVERVMPDPFVLVLALTALVGAAGLVAGDKVTALGLGERVWALGVGWSAEVYEPGLLKFAMQMALVLALGHALALAPPVRAALRRLSALPRSAGQAIWLVGLVSALASLLQWGLGVIVGALIAREVGGELTRRGVKVHYPLLGAAGYAGFMVWHGGLSGSAPLKVAEPGHFLEASVGVIALSRTIGSSMNLMITGALVVLIPLCLWAMLPGDEAERVGAPPALLEAPDEAERDVDAPGSPPARWLGRAAGLALCGWVVWGLSAGALVWGLDAINLAFLGLGLLCHRGPSAYMRAVGEGVRGCAGIILQFPLYFGIVGLLKASGLISQIAGWFAAVSSASTLEVWTFVSAGLLNMVIPSGGGQWAVQGPVMVDAALKLGVDPARVVMALAYGDAWTNMLQPFWALPLLGVMGLEARQIIGYTAVVLAVTGPVIALGLVFL